MAVVMVLRPPVVNTGRVLIYSVIAYGLFTILFGLARSFPLAVIFYMLVGAADQVSMVMRNTTIQLSTPDELRGRVSAVSQVFIGASNQLGAAESGFVAAATSATFAVVSGGIAAVAVALTIARTMPQLLNYRIGDRQSTGPPVDGRLVEDQGPATTAAS
jgi:MFS family permease